MSLLDQLKGPESGVGPKRGSRYPSWRPAKERTHPDSIEGVIVEVGSVPRREPRDGQPTHDDFIVVEIDGDEGNRWTVYGSVRDLRDRFDALKDEGLLVPGTRIAVRFFGSRKETANDGTPYSVHSYAVAAAAAP